MVNGKCGSDHYTPVMNSKERVYAALRRQPVDRVPIWMWFHPDTSRRLSGLLEIPTDFVAEAMGDDIRQTWVGNNVSMEGVALTKEGDTYMDEWGVEWIKRGHFNQVRHSPLEDSTDADIAAYRYPTNRIQELLDRMAPVMAHTQTHFVGCDISPCLFELVARLRGLEMAAMDLAASPDLVHDMFKQAADFSVQLAGAACDRYAIDWLWTGDDAGGQQSMIMRPAQWRALVRPHLQSILEVARRKRIWTAFHSCGSIRPVIPDLIEIGVDVLNPLQGNCPGMNPVELKQEFGKVLAFMGGVDTQELLPNGTAAGVYGSTRQLLEHMTADGGGYILAASHLVPPETPLENIFAMYAAAGVSRESIFDRAASIRCAAAGRG